PTALYSLSLHDALPISLETCSSPENQRFRDDLIAWQPVAPLLYVWDYTPNFAHYQQPFPNLDSLQPNVQFFIKHGVKGLFEQGKDRKSTRLNSSHDQTS